MRKIHVVLFFVVVAFGGHGCAILMNHLVDALFPNNNIGFGMWPALFFLLCLLFYADIRKCLKIREEERQEVEAHRRKKQSVILKNHPLYDSSDAACVISSRKALDDYYESHADEVADMDFDSTGHYVFKDHKFYK